MRTMYDAINLRKLPPGGDLYAGYVGGAWPTFSQLGALFPHAVLVSIAVNATENAMVLDVEAGDAVPADGPMWALRQRVLGGTPTIYCSSAVWPEVVAEFTRLHVALPLWWEAHYDGVAALTPGSIAKQYATGLYDTSVVADYWPGVDPLEDDMTPLQSQQLANVTAAVARLEVAVEDPTGGVRAQIASLEATVNRIAGKLGV